MRKKKFIYSALVGLLLLATGCINDDLPTTPSNDGGVEEGPQQPRPALARIWLATSVAMQGDMLGFVQENPEAGFTRAGTAIQSTQFDSGEHFYAYFPNGVRIGTTDGNHVTFSTDGSTTPATAQQLYFPAAVTNVPVHAYYPSAVTNTTSSFSVAADQTADANYKTSDLMYAYGEATRNPGDAQGSGTLTFYHRMAKIIVSATANTSKGVSTITDIRIVGGHRTIDIATPQTCTLGTTLTDANTTSDYISVYTGGTSATAERAALVVPETITGAFLQVVTNMGTATYSLDNKTFASGSSYTFNITISAASIGITTAITNWDNGGTETLVNDGTEALN